MFRGALNMIDLVLRKNNKGIFEFTIWANKQAGQKKNIQSYSFVMKVLDEKGTVVWLYEKTSYDQNDDPVNGYFRIPYNEALTSNTGTFVFLVDMIGNEQLTIIDGNLVIM